MSSGMAGGMVIWWPLMLMSAVRRGCSWFFRLFSSAVGVVVLMATRG